MCELAKYKWLYNYLFHASTTISQLAMSLARIIETFPHLEK